MLKWLVAILLCVSTAHAAVITRYVNTASDGIGCNGTTNGTTGANCAYDSFEAWKAAEATNLVTATNQHVVIMSGTTEDTVAVGNMDFTGWTTSATYNITIKTDSAVANSRHPGYWSTSHYRLVDTTADATTFQPLMAIHLNFDGIQFNKQPTSTTRAIFRHGSYASIWKFTNCIFKSSGTQTNTRAFRIDSANPTIYIQNSVFYDFKGTTSAAIYTGSTPTLYIMNNTFYNNTLGVTAATNTRLYNNIFQANTDGISGTATDENYNISNIAADLAGANSQNSVTLTFVNAASGDFHLAAGDAAAINTGYDISTNQPTWWVGAAIDMDGNSRSGTWDIGMDEYQSGATPTPTASPSPTTSATPTVSPTPGPGRPYDILLLGVGR